MGFMGVAMKSQRVDVWVGGFDLGNLFAGEIGGEASSWALKVSTASQRAWYSAASFSCNFMGSESMPLICLKPAPRSRSINC